MRTLLFAAKALKNINLGRISLVYVHLRNNYMKSEHMLKHQN